MPALCRKMTEFATMALLQLLFHPQWQCLLVTPWPSNRSAHNPKVAEDQAFLRITTRQ
jgi:hypothetical protein